MSVVVRSRSTTVGSGGPRRVLLPGGRSRATEPFRRGKRLPEMNLRTRRVRDSLVIVLLLFSLSLLSTSTRAQSVTEKYGELEEPGQIERRPVVVAAAPPDDSKKDESPDAKEATTILPDSEAVDETIDDDPVPQSDDAAASGGEAIDESSDKDDEVHADEATTILPDSEAVDESIEEDVGGEKRVAKKDGSKAAGSPEPPVRPQWSIRWQNAFIVERVDDPRYQFLFGGRLQNDWGVYEPDNDLKESFGGDGTGTKFRRARLYFQGQFFRYGFFKAEYEFSDGSDGTSFADVYAGINFPRVGLLRVGYFKEPFSLQFLNNSNFISFNERSGSNVFSPERNSGIMLNGNFLIRDSTYALAFMRRTDDIGDGFASQGDYHITARVTGLPYFEEGGTRLLHIELGYSHQFADKDVGTEYKQNPSNDFAPNIVDTGVLAAKSVELLNAGLAVVEGSLSLQSEVTASIPHGGFSENPVFWGAYAELSWWVTGEHRRYLRGRGVFSRVVPKNRFDPEKDHWGAVELALRYSWLDLSNSGIRGGTLSEWSFALNWSPFSNMRVSNNYVLSQTRDRASIPAIPGSPPVPAISAKSGFAHSWVTRFEIDF